MRSIDDYSSTNKKIALLEAKLLARQQAKTASNPSRTSSPALSMRDDLAAHEWLDSNAAGMGEKEKKIMNEDGAKGAEASEEGRTAGAISTGVIRPAEKQIKVDALKAGLPVRPYFDAAVPDKR